MPTHTSIRHNTFSLVLLIVAIFLLSRASSLGEDVTAAAAPITAWPAAMVTDQVTMQAAGFTIEAVIPPLDSAQIVTGALNLPLIVNTLAQGEPQSFLPQLPPNHDPISGYPFITRSEEQLGNDVTRVTFHVTNNITRTIDDFELTFNVDAAIGTVEAAGVTADPAALFDIGQTDDPVQVQCTFGLKTGQSLAPAQRADLSCTYRRGAGTIVTESETISPPPSAADLDYDQVHDFLAIQLASLSATDRISVVVLLARPVIQTDLALFASFGGEIHTQLELIDGFSGDMPAASVSDYRAAAGIDLDMIQPNLPIEFTIDTATANTRARNVWTGNLQGSNANPEPEYAFTGDPKTAIAVVDSGIDLTHPALGPFRNFVAADWNDAALVAANKIVGWMDFDPVVVSNIPFDQNGHGSNVAGIAAGTGAGVTGGLDLRGVAHTAKLVGVRVNMNFATNRIGTALTWLNANLQPYHVVVVNQSFGSIVVNPALIRASERMVASGVVVVNSAGNYFDLARPDGILIAGQAVAPKVLTVGAVNDADRISFFSSNGGDPRIYRSTKPDVVAPGGTQVIDNNFNSTWQMNGPDTNSPEPFIDTSLDGIHQAGDRCLDLNRNRRWDLHLDLFLDLNGDFMRQAGEPFLNNNGLPGFQAGGDFCFDTHLPAGNAFSGELYFDSNRNRMHDNPGGVTPATANDYAAQSGTSQAAPVVAGEVALIVDAITDYDADDADGDGRADEDRWDGIDNDNVPDDIIDEDVGEWVYDEQFARLVKSVVLMSTYEVAGGEIVPPWLFLDENGDGRAGGFTNPPAPAVGVPIDEYIRSGNNDFIYRVADGDVVVHLGANGVADTVNGDDFTPDDRDLLRDPIFKNAGASNAPGDDGSNGGVAGDGNTDHYDRGAKDPKEGFGRVAIDAAIEAVTKEFCAVESDTFGAGLTDKKVWARHLHLYTGKEYKLILEVPDGADYDLYLYQGIPSADGEPIIAKRPDNSEIKSTTAATADNANDEMVTFEVQANGLYFLVIRRVTGAGQFTVRLITPEEWTIMLYMPAELEGAADLDTLAFQALNDLEQTGSGEESMQAYQVLALVDYDQRAWDGKDGSGGQPDHRGDAVLYCIRKDHRMDRNQYSIAKQPTELLTLANSGLVTQTAEANMGDPETVRNFTAWAVDYFPAQKYALILWGDGRGYGWKVNPAKALGPGNDVKSEPGAAAPATFDALEMAELRTALADIKTEINEGSQYKENTGVQKNLDLLGFDMGHMALIEIGRQVQESVEVMVASEERIHDDGWPFKEFLSHLLCVRQGGGWNCDNPMDADGEALGKHAVEVYHTYYEDAAHADPKHTLSAVRLNPKPDNDELTAAQPNCQPFDALIGCVDAFGMELRAGVFDYLSEDDPTDNVQVKIEHEGRKDSEEMEDHNYIDLRHFAQNIRGSSVPAAYKTQSDPIFQALANDGPIILANQHGDAHPNAHGLTVYFPYDQLLPEDVNCKDAPDKGDRTCGFDSPLPAKHVYAKDGAILVPALRQADNLPTHPRPAIMGFRFPNDTNWDEFLHRYYKPVADACIRVQGACVEEAIVEVGETVTLSGRGSSDSDGPAMDDLPQAYYWDLDTTVDSAGAVPAYPIPPAVPIDDPCTEDCDRDAIDSNSDDPNASGVTVAFTCRAVRQYQFNLMVHDEHNDQRKVHDEENHYVHWKLDTESVTLQCVPPNIPRKVPDETVTTPGSSLIYTIYVPANPELTQMTEAIVQDQLPASVQLEEIVECTFDNCAIVPSTGSVQILATGSMAPEQLHILRYRVRIPPTIECPPETPPILENEAYVFDGLTDHEVSAQTTVDCSLSRPGSP